MTAQEAMEYGLIDKVIDNDNRINERECYMARVIWKMMTESCAAPSAEKRSDQVERADRRPGRIYL